MRLSRLPAGWDAEARSTSGSTESITLLASDLPPLSSWPIAWVDNQWSDQQQVIFDERIRAAAGRFARWAMQSFSGSGTGDGTASLMSLYSFDGPRGWGPMALSDIRLFSIVNRIQNHDLPSANRSHGP